MQQKKIFDAGFDRAAKNSVSPNFAAFWDKDTYFKDHHVRDLDGQNLNNLEKGVRWRIAQTSPDKAFMMRSLPAEIPASEFNPANNYPYSVIDFHFDGSINSLVYLAHEVGHSIADDTMRAAGYTRTDAMCDIDEIQAYFVQKIATDYLGRSPDPAIAKSARTRAEASWGKSFLTTRSANQQSATGCSAPAVERSISFYYASELCDFARKQDAESRRNITELLMGRQGPKDISEILEQAGMLKPGDHLSPQRGQQPELPVLAANIPRL